MGFQGSWAAVKTDDRAGALARIGYVETGQIDVRGEHRLACAELGEWLLVFAEDMDFISPNRLALMSAEGDVIGSQASEVVMYSSAFGYRKGAQLWAASHDPEKGLENLDVSGSPPEELDGIRATLLRKQASDEDGDVDYMFDAPLDLIRAVCGYRPDGDDRLPADTVLRVIEPVARGAGLARQARARAVYDRLKARVEAEVFPLAEGLGFEPMLAHPEFHERYRHGATTRFLRSRGKWSDTLTFRWGIEGNHYVIWIDFFVNRGAERRRGACGCAVADAPRRNFLQMLTGRENDQSAMEKLVAEARETLLELDLHLKEDTPSPRIEPARYQDGDRD